MFCERKNPHEGSFQHLSGEPGFWRKGRVNELRKALQLGLAASTDNVLLGTAV